jgi:DNA-binding CsgD family transcriptional regulator
MAELAAWQGQLDSVRAIADAALASLDDTMPVDPALGWLAWHVLRAEADAATAARARRDDAALRDVERRVARIADVLLGRDSVEADEDMRRAALAGLCRGEIGRVRGDPSAEGWDRTAAAWTSIGRPAPAAYARFRSGEGILTSHGDRATAAAALREAHVATVRLGASPLRAEIERLARHARIDIPDSGASEGGDAGDRLGLTDREAEVIRLVAAGRSNQQIADTLFITRKTASVHVSNIIGKLGVANRVEAAAVAQRLGMGGAADVEEGRNA